MTIEQIRRLLECSLDVADFVDNEIISVAFCHGLDDCAVEFFIDGDTYRVVRSSFCITETVHAMAAAYNRAITFIDRARLRPAS